MAAVTTKRADGRKEGAITLDSDHLADLYPRPPPDPSMPGDSLRKAARSGLSRFLPLS
jgi:hypothetical protein